MVRVRGESGYSQRWSGLQGELKRGHQEGLQGTLKVGGMRKYLRMYSGRVSISQVWSSRVVSV